MSMLTDHLYPVTVSLSLHWVCSHSFMFSLCSLTVCVLSVCPLSVLSQFMFRLYSVTVSLFTECAHSHLSSVYAHWQFTLSVCSLTNHISGVMVSMLVSSAVNRGFKSWSGQTKDYKIGICFFSTKQAAIKRKSKDRLARNRDNVFVWGDISIHRLLFQCASTIKIQLIVLVWYKADLIITISLKNCWVGIKQQSLSQFMLTDSLCSVSLFTECAHSHFMLSLCSLIVTILLLRWMYSL